MSRTRRVLLALLGLAVVTGVSVWWYATTRPEYRLRLGREALQRGEFEEAHRAAERLEAGGHTAFAHLLRAEVQVRRAAPYLDGRRFDRAAPLLNDALNELSKVRETDPVYVDGVALSGRCLLWLKELARAEKAFQFVLSERPEHLDALRGLAAVYFDLGALAHSVGYLEEVARLDPDDGRPHRQMGLIFKDLEQRDRAAASYREALRRGLAARARQEVLVELAEVLVRQGKADEALALLDRCDGSVAGEAHVAALRAECLWSKGRADEAVPLLDRALGAYPRPGGALLLRAKIHLARDEAADAARLLQEAVARDRNDHASRYQLAQAYERMGRRDDAAEQRRLAKQTQEDLTQLTKLNEEADRDPWDASVRERLAELCRKLDRHEDAAMWERSAAAARRAPRP